MNCINCGVSALKKPLSRTNPKGQPDAGWMCQDCIKEKEPELHKNLKEDGEFKISNEIFTAINDAKNIMTRYKCTTCGNTCLQKNKPDNSICGGCKNPNWEIMEQQESYII